MFDFKKGFNKYLLNELKKDGLYKRREKVLSNLVELMLLLLRIESFWKFF